MNSLLRTVTGPLSVSAVRGPVLAHEHLALDLTRATDRAAFLGAGTPQRWQMNWLICGTNSG